LSNNTSNNNMDSPWTGINTSNNNLDSHRGISQNMPDECKN